MALSNIFIAKQKGNGVAEVLVNYTIPKYRDFKIGNYLFNAEKHHLKEMGISNLHYSEVANKGHIDFLKKNGFVKGPGETEYSKAL